MKIKALGSIGSIEADDILEAIISPDKTMAVAFDQKTDINYFYFYKDTDPKFTIVEDELSIDNKKIYTLEELKALKELFK